MLLKPSVSFIRDQTVQWLTGWIVLNYFSNASTKIIDLEDSIVQLKEDLVHEREEARQEKEKLKQSVVNNQQCMLFFYTHMYLYCGWL